MFDEYRCAHCGELLDGNEPYWVVAYPKSAHARCIDWTTREFPFRRQLVLLRRAWRETTEADARRLIEEAGRWLAVLERRWRSGERSSVDVNEAGARLRGLLRLAGGSGVSDRIKQMG